MALNCILYQRFNSIFFGRKFYVTFHYFQVCFTEILHCASIFCVMVTLLFPDTNWAGVCYISIVSISTHANEYSVNVI